VTDRRVRRSRRALRDAFVALIDEVGYAAITVDDLIERADVSRGTFYAHYRDLADLLGSVIDEVVERFRTRIDDTAPPTSAGFTGEPVLAVVELVGAEPALFGALLRGEGDGQAVRRLRTAFAAIALEVMERRAATLCVTPRLPLDLVAQAWTGELLTVLSWWLEHDQPYPAEVLARMLRDYSVHGRAWANGFDPASLAAPVTEAGPPASGTLVAAGAPGDEVHRGHPR